jgi:hypothetical protein
MCPDPKDGGCGGCKTPGTCPVFYNNNIGECTATQVSVGIRHFNRPLYTMVVLLKQPLRRLTHQPTLRLDTHAAHPRTWPSAHPLLLCTPSHRCSYPPSPTLHTPYTHPLTPPPLPRTLPFLHSTHSFTLPPPPTHLPTRTPHHRPWQGDCVRLARVRQRHVRVVRVRLPRRGTGMATEHKVSRDCVGRCWLC